MERGKGERKRRKEKERGKGERKRREEGREEKERGGRRKWVTCKLYVEGIFG